MVRHPVIAALVLVSGCNIEMTGPVTRARVDAASEESCPSGGIVIGTGIAEEGEELSIDAVGASTDLCKLAPAAQCPDGAKVYEGSITTPLESAQREKLRDVTCIEGDLLVLNSDEVDIADFDALEVITGHLAIAGNPHLTEIDGFPKLRSVAGTALLQGNDDLVDLRRIATLHKAGTISIIANPHLPDLTGFDRVTKLSANLVIAGNAEMTSLTGLDDLEEAASITIHTSSALATLDALDHLTTVGSLTVAETLLSRFEPKALKTVSGDLTIEHNIALKLVSPVALASAENAMLDDNPALAVIELPALQTASSLRVKHSAKLLVLSAPTVANIGDLELVDVPSLSMVTMPDLTTLDSLTLRHTGLADLSSFQLTSLGDLTVSKCENLKHLVGLEEIKTLDSFEVKDSGVSSLSELASLSSVTGDFTFTSNALRGKRVKDFVDQLEVGGKTTLDE